MTTACAAADVVVVGDGPAGLALAAACVELGVDTLVVGEGRRWTATLGTWVDDVAHLPRVADTVVMATPAEVVAPPGGRGAAERRVLGRHYGAFDRALLRERLDVAPTLQATVSGVRHHRGESVLVTSAGEVRARLVVDASGAEPVLGGSPRPTGGRRGGAQTAFGVVLDHRPDVLGGEGTVLMDWRPATVDGRFDGPPTFCYVLGLPDGKWLVEETALVARPALSQRELEARLTARLGSPLVQRAEHVERVHIPMAPGLADRRRPVVAFGAAAGYLHPATGYSVAASLRAAPRVAAALATAVDLGDQRWRARSVWDAVWPAAHRRTRQLHDHGLRALLRLPSAVVPQFFGAFFDLPEPQWRAYLRIDSAPAEISLAMAGVFRRLPWSVRRRLLPLLGGS